MVKTSIDTIQAALNEIEDLLATLEESAAISLSVPTSRLIELATLRTMFDEFSDALIDLVDPDDEENE